MRVLLIVAGLLLMWMPSTLLATESPFVYSRCPRPIQPLMLSAPVTKDGVTTMVTRAMNHPDLAQDLPDTDKEQSGFLTPCDLVYNDGDGNERILYSCIGNETSSESCSALEPGVSNDGKKIAFAVWRGKPVRPRGVLSAKDFDPSAENADKIGFEYPFFEFAAGTTTAQIYVIDVATGALTSITSQRTGVIDSAPVWLPDNRIAFTSTRASAGRTLPFLCTNSNSPASQLHVMDADGRRVERISPHALGSELHPYMLADGRLLFSSWQAFGSLAHRHPNTPGLCGTISNFFHLYAMNPDGSDQFAIYGQHITDPTSHEYQSGKGIKAHMAAHFVTQTSDGRVWAAEYYRGNNLGLGNIVGFPLPPEGVEGISVDTALRTNRRSFRLENQVYVANWSSQSDQVAARLPEIWTRPGDTAPLQYAGKMGHPAALPNNGLMFVWAAGACFTALGAPGNLKANYVGNPGCDAGIYRYAGPLPATGTAFSAHPRDLVRLVDRPEFQEFFPRAVVPYSAIMGVNKPATRIARNSPLIQAAEPYGEIASGSIYNHETKPASEDWNRPEAFNQQGTDTIKYSDSEICGVRMLATQPARAREITQRSVATTGDRLTILGEFPVLRDGSFRVKFPANVPYIMQTIDCKGRTLNTDQTWQHLKAGELKACDGCHAHSYEKVHAAPFDNSEAAKLTAPMVVLGDGTVPLIDGTRKPGLGYVVEYERDIWPIFQSRCVACHGDERTEAGLRLDIPTTRVRRDQPADGSTYDRLVFDWYQKYVPAEKRIATRWTGGVALVKPNLSKYVRMLSARASLLYWKAANARTDGRTDTERSGDIKFGADHPTDITEEELAILGRWLDMGAPWGPDYAQDTLPPTLVAIVREAGDGKPRALLIGVHDVGSGIDETSLRVCVGDSCEPISSPPIPEDRQVEIDLSFIDPKLYIQASVSDIAGNVTSLMIRPPSVYPGGSECVP